MTSAINTGAIDGTYPTPGVNNSSQGFRTNFTTIKTNLNTAASEITELQNKSIFKSALSGTTLNNDMANALISNASTLGFSQVAYNIGSSITGSLTIDKAKGDYQYGVATGNITAISFTNWAPSGNYSEVTVSLSVQPGMTITFPYQVTINSLATIENTATFNGITTLTVPANTYQVTWKFYTTDCGTTIQIAPVDRPRKSTQLITRTVASNTIGSMGDVAGDIAYSNGNFWICNGAYTGTSPIWNQVTGGGNPTSIINGTSNVMVDFNGLVRIGSQGNANIFTVSGTGSNVTGNLNISSNLNVSGITVFNSGSAESVAFPVDRGVNGQVLQSVGDGTMVWGTVSGGGTSNGAGGANSTVQFNNNGNLLGSSNFTWNTLTSNLTLNGNLGVGGLVNATNLSVSGNSTFNNITANAITIFNSLSINANINVGNIVASGTIRAASITATGTGPVTVNSSSSIILNSSPTGGGVAIANGAPFTLSGNLITTVRSNPQGAVGTQGQIAIDINTNRIWVCYGGTVWRYATLIAP